MVSNPQVGEIYLMRGKECEVLEVRAQQMAVVKYIVDGVSRLWVPFSVLKSPEKEFNNFSNNLYKRYLLIRLEAIGDVLELVRRSDDQNGVIEILIDYIQKRAKFVFDEPLDILDFIPSAVLNADNDLTALLTSGASGEKKCCKSTQ